MEIAIKQLKEFESVESLSDYIKENNILGKLTANVISLNCDGNITIMTYYFKEKPSRYKETYMELYEDSPLSNLKDHVTLKYNNNQVLDCIKNANDLALIGSIGLAEFDNINSLMENIYYILAKKQNVRLYIKYETSNFHQGVLLSYFCQDAIEEYCDIKFICNDTLHERYN